MYFKDMPVSRRVWLDHAGGWLVPSVYCPQCLARVVYNGNYFREHWTPKRTSQLYMGECNWALPHLATDPFDVAVCRQLGIDPNY